MPVEPTGDRLRRITVLVPWVMRRGGASVDEVCAQFGITPRELTADIDLLMLCGLPPFSPADYIEAAIDGDRVTIQVPGAIDRPPKLTRGEGMALLVAARAVAALPGVEEAASLRSATEKLAAAVAPNAAPEAEDLADRIAVSLGSEGADMVARLRRAAESRRRIRIVYWTESRGELTERMIDPLVVYGTQGSWYVAAMDHQSGEERSFRADRIRELEETGEPAEEPDGFDPARYVRGHVFVASADDLTCVIDLARPAWWISDVVPTDTVEQLSDDRIRITVRARALPWLVRLLLSAGLDAEPREPAELRDAVRAAAIRALERYSS